MPNVSPGVVSLGDVRWNTLQFNTNELLASLVSYFVSVMEKEEEKTIETMRQELFINSDGPRASSSEIYRWKDMVSRSIKMIYRDIAREYIESQVGLDSAEGEEAYRKAIIIAQGGGPTTTRPGEVVWDEHYSGQHTSRAKAAYPLPSTWQIQGGGNKWIDNAAKKMRVYFHDILDAACSGIPAITFSGNLMVL